ncbi:MAG TPA: ribonuclease R, partial [Gammaproteobacteria bacterium]
GTLVEVLERATEEVAGSFIRERGIDLVIPDKDSNARVLIPRGKAGGARAGDVVRASIINYPTVRTDAIGEVTRVLGRGDDPGIETIMAILSHGLPDEWPEPVERHAATLPEHVPAKAKRDRVDLRELALVTIDGADAKDFDDAVYCESRGDGWRLIVAIADVSHYVETDSPLDQAALARGTSVYFPDRVLPMLPEVLSNGLCSLRPKVDRLCLCCEMDVARTGEVTRSRFYEGVMRSAARLTYVQAADLLEGKSRRTQALLRDRLGALNDVYRAFAKRRRRRGALEFDLPQTRIELDDRGRVADVHVVERLVTHRIIEECMIAANVEAARKIAKARIPALYRVHEGPDPDKVDELVLFLQSVGIKLSSPRSIKPRDLSRIIESAAGGPEAELIEAVILRTMSRARYQPRNIGHFGLALSGYAHFTSPIRRYPDLLVHRAIKHLLRHGGMKGYRYPRPEMERLGEQCSRAERRADEAVWQVEERLKCRYLEQHIGDEFDVLVTAVTPFGLFVRLPGLQMDGLIHVTALPGDYYRPGAGGTELKGERSGTTYRLMDELRVELVNVDTEERKIDFVPTGGDRSPERRRKRRGRG